MAKKRLRSEIAAMNPFIFGDHVFTTMWTLQFLVLIITFSSTWSEESETSLAENIADLLVIITKSKFPQCTHKHATDCFAKVYSNDTCLTDAKQKFNKSEWDNKTIEIETSPIFIETFNKCASDRLMNVTVTNDDEKVYIPIKEISDEVKHIRENDGNFTTFYKGCQKYELFECIRKKPCGIRNHFEKITSIFNSCNSIGLIGLSIDFATNHVSTTLTPVASYSTITTTLVQDNTTILQSTTPLDHSTTTTAFSALQQPKAKNSTRKVTMDNITLEQIDAVREGAKKYSWIRKAICEF